MRAITRGICWTTAYLVLAYILQYYAIMFAGGGDGNLSLFGVYIVFTFPASLGLYVIDLLQAPLTPSSSAYLQLHYVKHAYIYWTPTINIGLLWLIVLSVKFIRKMKKDRTIGCRVPSTRCRVP